ncbi:HAMP domain-containing sensor histidine kinase [Globicatella sp. PHS-GS-PNBC-21-1553]|uniref:sensor histidine kinase n=1 Tax=Globicatella sp. PHS-GS-PNBC-21-1553 TaxID=2885764 RepID=UPI00298EEA28|nr:HAMP domain-containing sensor histidine kinase [Globicatella sp. PHS-GS-PNBC-21-1553]
MAVLSTNNDVMEMIGYKNEWTESNRNQIKRLNMLIEQMLLLARFDEGKNTIELTKVNLTDLIKNEINELSTLIKENDKTILLELPDNLVETTDEASMRQLTTILLENAVKYHVGSEPIIIKWQPAKRELWFENECDPMTEEERKQLFERFYRRDTARNREQGGSGMGLSIAAAVAKAAGLKLTTELINPSCIAFKIGFNGHNKDSWQIKERLFKK